MQYPTIDGFAVIPNQPRKAAPRKYVGYDPRRDEDGQMQGEIAFWGSDAGRDLLDSMTRHAEAEIAVATTQWQQGTRRRIMVEADIMAHEIADAEARSNRAHTRSLYEGQVL